MSETNTTPVQKIESKPYNIRVTSTEAADVKQDDQGREMGSLTIHYTTGDGRKRTIAAEAHGRALQITREMFGQGSYTGPLYGVFERREQGQVFRIINNAPPPALRLSQAA